MDTMKLCLRKYLIPALLSLICASGIAADYGKVTTQKVADGVYLFRTTSYGDVGMSGNSAAILTKDGVVVFDSSAIPQTAEIILNEIRKLSGKPVIYLINSHWHWDHWGGNQVFQSAFPNVQIVSHEKTREQMIEVEPRWNDDGLKVGLPGFLQDFEKKVAEAKASNSDAADIKQMEERLAANKNFYEQKISLKKTYPNVTFSESMTIRPGSREILILHARGITVGDTYVFLPKEKILITGDLLLHPYPYAIGGAYPADWLKTLRHFAGLHPAIIIPGHGDPQTAEFLQANIALFESALEQIKNAKSSGRTLEQTRDAINEESGILAQNLGISDPQMIQEFKAYFLNVFATRAFRELDQPLGDLPDGLK
jgi:glyoxylase-like metal-dependent hydrolase (beta-lactamase superfamily II)